MSATASAKAAARCTTRLMISTTQPFPTVPACWPGWSSASSPGSIAIEERARDQGPGPHRGLSRPRLFPVGAIAGDGGPAARTGGGKLPRCPAWQLARRAGRTPYPADVSDPVPGFAVFDPDALADAEPGRPLDSGPSRNRRRLHRPCRARTLAGFAPRVATRDPSTRVVRRGNAA